MNTLTANESCSRCGCITGHANQREDYPITSRVRTLIELGDDSNMLPNVSAGTEGEVVGHCDNDGRAIVEFDGFNAPRTFHYPEGIIEKI